MIASAAVDEIDRLLLRNIPSEAPFATTTELVRTLAAAGHPLTPRAVQKRLASLELEGVIACERDGKPYRWSVDARSKRALLAPMLPHEALALALADEHLSRLLPPKSRAYLRERLREAEDALEREHGQRTRRWRTKVKRVPSELERRAPRVDRAVFEAVSQALDEELALEVSYRKRYARRDARRRLHPLGILERSDALWLVARVEEDGELGDVRNFALHRMRRVAILRGVPAKPPPRFSLDRWVAEGHAHFRLGDEIRLVSRFRADVADRLEESPFADDQTLEDLGDGWVRLRATVPFTRALTAFLLSYGAHCEVEAPSALREHLRGELDEAACRYRV